MGAGCGSAGEKNLTAAAGDSGRAAPDGTDGPGRLTSGWGRQRAQRRRHARPVLRLRCEGNDTILHSGSGAPVKLSGDEGDDLCIFKGGDELVSCERW